MFMEKEVNSYSFIILVQLPMKSGIRPVKLLSLILLGSHKYNKFKTWLKIIYQGLSLLLVILSYQPC